MILVDYEKLKHFVTDAFKKLGFTDEDSAIITDVLLRADLYGVESHGVQRLVRYQKSMEGKTIFKDAPFEICHETPISAVIDGHSGMGQVIAYKAMKKAIEKAKTTGIGLVSVRNSNHFGIAGYYAEMAMREGLVGISMTNSEAIMVHTYAKKPVLGTNPIAIAAPAKPYPFYFDAATTVVPRGKLEVYKKKEKPLPDGWASDETGNQSNDASRVLDAIIGKVAGGIFPLGGDKEESGSHKGYGYAMICEIATAIASGGQTSNHHVRKEGQGAGSCHFFAAIDPKIFGDPKEMEDHLSTLLTELREAPKAEGATRIYTHGEKEAEAIVDRKKNGIQVNEKTMAEMENFAKVYGMDIQSYFGN